MKKQISIGDKVAYSANWLRSVGLMTGEQGFWRGHVTALETFGKDFTLATIDWGHPDGPARVNVKNLAKVGSAQMSAN